MDSDLLPAVSTNSSSGGGRGRGRGRGGGVPLLPKGVWESLHSTENANEEEEAIASYLKSSTTEKQYEDAEEKPTADDRAKFDKDLKGKDWYCPSCANHNWSWRTNCNMCGTPKPFTASGKDEGRDGAGGGFNERQNRASAATVEIDEEGFDDFGRRVKKEKSADKKAKEEAALKRLQEKYKYLLPETLSTINELPVPSNSQMLGKGKDDENQLKNSQNFNKISNNGNNNRFSHGNYTNKDGKRRSHSRDRNNDRNRDRRNSRDRDRKYTHSRDDDHKRRERSRSR